MKVSLTITSRVTSDGDTAHHHDRVDGFLRRFDDYTELSYREQGGEEGLGNTLTTLRLYADKMELIRRGDYTCVLTMETGCRHECLYQTPFGQLTLITDTTLYGSTVQQNGGDMRVCYTLDAGNGTSTHELCVTATPVLSH